MTVPPTPYQTTCQVRMSGTTIHKYMQICMVLQPDVCHIQNAGYTRVRTYITESDLEIYPSIPSILIQFIRRGINHVHEKPSTKNHSTRYALNHFFRWILHPQDHQRGSRSLRRAGSDDIVRLPDLTDSAPSVIYVDAALRDEQQLTCYVRRTIIIWSPAIATIHQRRK